MPNEQNLLVNRGTPMKSFALLELQSKEGLQPLLRKWWWVVRKLMNYCCHLCRCKWGTWSYFCSLKSMVLTCVWGQRGWDARRGKDLLSSYTTPSKSLGFLPCILFYQDKTSLTYHGFHFSAFSKHNFECSFC